MSDSEMDSAADEGEEQMEVETETKTRKGSSRRSKPTKTEEEEPHNDYCEICQQGGEIVLCDTCPRAYHLECANLTENPEGAWSCSACDKNLDGAAEDDDNYAEEATPTASKKKKGQKGKHHHHRGRKSKGAKEEETEVVAAEPKPSKKSARNAAKESTPKEKTLPPIKIRISGRKRKYKDSDDPDSDEEFDRLLIENDKIIAAAEKAKEERKAQRKAEAKAKKNKKIQRVAAEDHNDFCEYCKNGAELLLCETCPRAFHLNCTEL
uniref:PHD-type domain-containing protein n=1 Tax=Panagrolaimus sp. PS1159 TaxID=55785 RepID=A0AC35EV50_9BILA